MICEICGGKIEEKKISYSTLYKGKPIVVRNVNARVCSQCGEESFDPEVVRTLQKTIWDQATPQEKVDQILRKIIKYPSKSTQTEYDALSCHQKRAPPFGDALF